jgi:putative sterol carrier protein
VNTLADALARLVRRASPRVRELLMRGFWGRAIAAIILRAMPRRLRTATASGLDLVVRWQVGEDPTRYLTVREGGARLRRAADRDPDLSLTLDRVALLELATGAANGPQLFMTGRVRITGDVMLAQRLTSLFSVPGAV